MSVYEKVLDTAESLFNRRGYTAVGIDLIRDEAGISKTTIYRHFSSKAVLIEHVLKRRHKRFHDSIAQALSAEVGISGKIEALINWHFDWFNSEHFEGCMFMHALSEFKQQDAVIKGVSQDHKEWLFDVIYDLLGEKNSEYQHKAELMMTFLEGMIIRAEFKTLRLSKQECVDQMCRIAFYS
ncbi:TetR/AcrR family transcriptional regulator [Alteromonas sp. a30]|uniref:TetR/AcrR family transcriptional regulator n=1 Tax=Alteromonas sp. a30 TaxID=2730917 RepID=UPI0022810686|nr:TetR/AcrR family transcriptional regulator [Alteromonas sp. a30]MCY7295418.1 TetR/AcrR family transcriptional regulator [Alteromonas sp. a30]